jgi:Flp pilus assembly pilin Flp
MGFVDLRERGVRCILAEPRAQRKLSNVTLPTGARRRITLLGYVPPFWVMSHLAPAAYGFITKAFESRILAATVQLGIHMKQLLKNLVHEDSGQDVIEYVLLSTLIALSSLAVIRAYNVDIKGSLNGLGNSLTNAIGH